MSDVIFRHARFSPAALNSSGISSSITVTICPVWTFVGNVTLLYSSRCYSGRGTEIRLKSVFKPVSARSLFDNFIISLSTSQENQRYGFDLSGAESSWSR
jgi:hypothetical protein